MADQPDYRALYEEERRGREEERQGRLKAELDAQQAHRARLETAAFNRSLQEELQQHKDETKLTAAFNRSLQEELQQHKDETKLTAAFNRSLQEELQQHKDETNLQSLPAYLAQITRLHAHAARLLPHHAPRQRSQAQSQSNSPTRASSPQPSTSGRTGVEKKYYPLHLQPWTDFHDVVQRDGFARIYAALQPGGDVPNGLPSRHWIQRDEETLLGQLPLQALDQDGALNAMRTNNFLNAVLLIPASRVLNQYIRHTGSSDMVFFDNAIEAVTIDVPRVPNTQNAEATNTSSNISQIPGKVRPDCVVLAMATDTTTNTTTDTNPVLPISDSTGLERSDATIPARRIAVGEHKPCHALRAASVSHIINSPLAEDYMVRLAREALERREKRRAAPSQSAPELQPGVESGPGPAAATRTSKISKQTYFAFALTQTYHYMLLSGVEFGYLSTGEVIVFLRILEDDPATLYYHVALFPIPGGHIPGPVTGAPFSEEMDVMGEDVLRELSVAQMVSFCELALRSPLRSTSWIAGATERLAHFPELPPGVASQYNQGPSSTLGRRQRDDDDDDNGGDNNGRPRSSRHQLHSPLYSNRVQASSPLQHGFTADQGPGSTSRNISTGPMALDVSTSFLSTECDLWTHPWPSRQVLEPTLDYCTQACLLGLVQHGLLDEQCPNYALHRAASNKKGYSNGHAITQLELAQGIRDQLHDTPEVNCKYYVSYRGAIGYPFKLTLTGYGYTFVGKGVAETYRQRLVHESQIYRNLLPLQGSVIPVHLGLIKLHVAYPVASLFLQLPYMMLLSYAGESIARVNTTELAGIDLEIETARTLQELAGCGLNDEDRNITNFRWCREVGRVMRIDFDRADLLPSQHGSQTAASSGAPATPETTGAADAAKGADIKDWERPAKRTRYSNDRLAEIHLGN